MAVVDGPVVRGRGRRRSGRVRDVALGSNRRIGLWILPLFLVVGLLGAVLAGTLAVLYYGQQVRRLEDTTAVARAEVAAARDEVGAAAAQARADIEAQVEGVQTRLAAGAPITAPNEAGVYAVAADHARGEVRVGSAFTVYSDARETFLVTSYRLVATADGAALQRARVFIPGSEAVEVVVHGYDRDLDLAVLVAAGGPLPVPPWRPPEEVVPLGDGVFAVGVAGSDTAAAVEGTVAGTGPRALVADLPLNGFLSGAPVVDGAGRVVAVASLDYAPFGQVQGELRYAVPIRLLCERLLQCSQADLGAGGLGPGGGSGAAPAPADLAVAPSEAPSPVTPATSAEVEAPSAVPSPQAPPPVVPTVPSAETPSPG